MLSAHVHSAAVSRPALFSDGRWPVAILANSMCSHLCNLMSELMLGLVTRSQPLTASIPSFFCLNYDDRRHMPSFSWSTLIQRFAREFKRWSNGA